MAKNSDTYDYLCLISNGTTHIIHFMGIEIYNSFFTKMYEEPTVEQQMERNTRENFEKYIRECIEDELKTFQNISML
jgi:hypothetical protein